jgi:hypothetical protein
LTDIQAKLLYLKIAGGLKAFGGKYYTAKLVSGMSCILGWSSVMWLSKEREQSEITVLVSPQSGFCHVVSRQRNLVCYIGTYNEVLCSANALDCVFNS